MKSGGTRAQMKLSFGMIFSIILIIVFICFAFYAIQKILEIQEIMKVRKFVDNLEIDIEKIWKGSQGSQEVEYILPKEIEYVCFVDCFSGKSGTNKNLYDELKDVCYNDENLIFYPIGSAEGLAALEIVHIDILKITETENPFCVENNKGKVKMIVKKSFGEDLVVIDK